MSRVRSTNAVMRIDFRLSREYGRILEASRWQV